MINIYHFGGGVKEVDGQHVKNEYYHILVHVCVLHFLVDEVWKHVRLSLF